MPGEECRPAAMRAPARTARQAALQPRRLPGPRPPRRRPGGTPDSTAPRQPQTPPARGSTRRGASWRVLHGGFHAKLIGVQRVPPAPRPAPGAREILDIHHGNPTTRATFREDSLRPGAETLPDHGEPSRQLRKLILAI